MDNRKFIGEAVTVPVTLGAGVEVFSEVFHMNALTGAEAFVYVGNVAKLGTGAGDFTATAYASHNGTDFFTVATETVAYNATPAIATKVLMADFAPYFKVGVKSAATGGLQTGHGVKVDVVLVEKNAEYKRAYSVASMDADTDSITISLDSGVFHKVNVFAYADTGALTDLDYTLETSMDGVVWYSTKAVKTQVAAAALPLVESYENKGFMKYVRFNPSSLTYTTTGTINVAMFGVGY